MTALDKFAQLPDTARCWASIAITFVIAALVTLMGIYWIGEYGIAIFVLTPLFVGISTSALFGYKHEMTRSTAFIISCITMGLMTFCLLLFAIEGLVCIIMATPIGLLLTWVGSVVGHNLVAKKPQSTMTTLITLALFIPLTSFVEHETVHAENNVLHVTTAVTINASREKVWNNVIAFPQLDEPTELLFKAGIAYPIHATINGKGVGAVRRCNFTTGCFVEPITRWDEPSLLSFDVKEFPLPMKELSFWDIDAPHLHDYFVSKKGQFKLIKLSENETLLEGTTWYYNKIKPGFYWQLWSDYIIHKIHNRVLDHIKKTSEKH